MLSRSEILGLFVNTFTANGKYSCCSMPNFQQQLQTPLLQEQKFSSIFLLDIWNVHEIYNVVKKKMSLLDS